MPAARRGTYRFPPHPGVASEAAMEGGHGELIAFAVVGSALLAGAIASAKNRNGCLFVLLGPIGLVAAILIPRGRDPEEGEEEGAEDATTE